MKSILVIGLGRFGRHICMKLNDLNHLIMAVDVNEERVNNIISYVTNAQIGDSTNSEFLLSLGVENFDACIVAIGDNFQNSLETASLLKELGAKRSLLAPLPVFKKNFFLEMVLMKLFIQKNNLLFGQPFAVVQIIFWII